MSGKPRKVETRPYHSEKGLSAAFYDLTTAADQGLARDVEFHSGLEPDGPPTPLAGGEIHGFREPG